MTCITYLRDGDEIVLGADRCECWGNKEYVMSEPKLYNKPILVKKENEEDEQKTICVVIAGAGYAGISNFIKYGFTAPEIEEGENFDSYLSAAFLPDLKKELVKAGLIEVAHELTDIDGLMYLFYQGKVYNIDAHLGFTLDRDLEYNAIGSGSAYAMGSLATSSKKTKPENRVKKSIEAAAKHISGVNDIIDVVRLTSDSYECK